jgi:hypothetical protein
MEEMMQKLVNKLNEKMIHPEKDYDLLQKSCRESSNALAWR